MRMCSASSAMWASNWCMFSTVMPRWSRLVFTISTLSHAVSSADLHIFCGIVNHAQNKAILAPLFVFLCISWHHPGEKLTPWRNLQLHPVFKPATDQEHQVKLLNVLIAGMHFHWATYPLINNDCESTNTTRQLLVVHRGVRNDVHFVLLNACLEIIQVAIHLFRLTCHIWIRNVVHLKDGLGTCGLCTYRALGSTTNFTKKRIPLHSSSL